MIAFFDDPLIDKPGQPFGCRDIDQDGPVPRDYHAMPVRVLA
jgi:hypothetical protein